MRVIIARSDSMREFSCRSLVSHVNPADNIRASYHSDDNPMSVSPSRKNMDAGLEIPSTYDIHNLSNLARSRCGNAENQQRLRYAQNAQQNHNVAIPTIRMDHLLVATSACHRLSIHSHLSFHRHCHLSFHHESRLFCRHHSRRHLFYQTNHL